VAAIQSSRAASSDHRLVRLPPPGNCLLDRAPPEVRHHIVAQSQRVTLRRGLVLFRANESVRFAFFLESGVMSLLARSAGGDVLEMGVVGRDGMAGMALIPGVNMMPYDGVMQVEGTALRIPADTLKELVQVSSPFHQLLGRYAYTVFATGIQTAVCNNFHSVRERCARWLLMLHDLADADTFALTQSLLALTLGVRRPSITIAANALHRARLVNYHHGRMTIHNRRGLEAAACECYRLIREQQLRLLEY